jgi:hypothetical protein
LFDHPDAHAAYDRVHGVVSHESDRGAVLISAAEVDGQLRRLIEAGAPTDMTSEERKRVFSYPGPLSSFAARADVAFTTRLISRRLFSAITHLRQLRNDVAHSPETFRLADHLDRVRGIFETGDDMPYWINRLTVEAQVKGIVNSMLQIEDPVDPTTAAFGSPGAALDYLAERPDLTAILEDRRPRFELALGVSILCALIINHREAAHIRSRADAPDGGAA